MKHILITGGAGFIGSNLTEKLLKLGYNVTTIDNFDSFYPREIKEKNIHSFINHPNYKLIEADIRDTNLAKILPNKVDVIVHLAAKAGVRPSIDTPITYQEVNIIGTHNLLEWAKNVGCNHFIFGSSSSVYGVNKVVPWSESNRELQPISPYAATKFSGEMLGHVYHKLYNIRFIALRFFTVYGERQRPDLAIHKFAQLIADDQPITLYGDGSTSRDYTYVGDIVSGLLAAIKNETLEYEIINLGNKQTVSLLDMVHTLEAALDKKAKIHFIEKQAGDVDITFANINKAKKLLGYSPTTTFEDGIRKFVLWFNQSKNENKQKVINH